LETEIDDDNINYEVSFGKARVSRMMVDNAFDCCTVEGRLRWVRWSATKKVTGCYTG